MKGPITNSSIEIKYNIDYLIVGSGLIMVCMNDSSIFCDDSYNLHLTPPASQSMAGIQRKSAAK